MSKKKNYAVYSFLIFLVCLVVTVCATSGQSVTDTLTKWGNTVRVENDNYRLDWKGNVQGHTPGDSTLYRISGTFETKKEDITADLIFLSDAKLDPKTSITLTHYETTSSTNQYSDYCGSAAYGWKDVGRVAYCDTTDPKNDSTTRRLIYIGGPYSVDAKAGSATYFWNVTTQEQTKVSNSYNLISKSMPTTYGSELKAVQGITFKANTEYQIEINAYASLKSDLKYSVGIGDANSGTMYFVLDPTLESKSRYWGYTPDYDNGTVHTNVTFLATIISLSDATFNETKPAGTCTGQYCEWWTFDTSTSGRNITDNAYKLVNLSTYGGGGIGVTTVKLSNQLRCDGVDDYAINSSGDPWGGTPVNFSLGGWVKLGGPFTDGMYIFASQGPYLRLDFFWDQATNGPYFQLRGDTNKVVKTVMADTNWHHYAFTWDGLRLAMYLDGTIVNDDNQSSTPSAGQWASVIFCQHFTGGSNTNMSADDWFMMKNRVLNASEISAIYYSNAIPGKFTRGMYSDRQGWSPSYDNSITNISIGTRLRPTTSVLFRYSSDNTTLDAASWINLTINGTNDIALNMSRNAPFFYQFQLLDDGSYPNTTISYSGSVTEYTLRQQRNNSAPVITLLSPPNATLNSSSDPKIISFNYSATDDFNASLSCDLQINNTITNSTTVSNQSVIITYDVQKNATFRWYVNCSDTDPEIGRRTSGTRYFSTDSNPPIITVILWPNNTQKINAETTFNFSIFEESNLTSVNISINSVTRAVPLNNLTINQTMTADTVYNWNLSAADENGYSNITPNYIYIRDNTAPQINNVTAASTATQGDTVKIYINTTDNFQDYDSLNVVVAEVQQPSTARSNYSASVDTTQPGFNYAVSLTVTSTGTYTVTNVYSTDKAGMQQTNGTTLNIAVSAAPSTIVSTGSSSGGSTINLITGAGDFTLKPAKIDTYLFYTPFTTIEKSKDLYFIGSENLQSCKASNADSFDCSVDGLQAKVTFSFSNDSQLAALVTTDATITATTGKAVTAKVTARVLNLAAYVRTPPFTLPVMTPYIFKIEYGQITGIRYIAIFGALFAVGGLWGGKRKISKWVKRGKS